MASPFLSKAAADALAAQKDALVTAARTCITTVLGEGADAAALTESEVQADEHLVVFTDGAIYLAVTAAGTDTAAVHLVHDDDGWTSIAELTSMADLGVALAKGASA